MKILLLACLAKNKYGNAYGGAEKSIINLANWLSKNNQVYLASVEGDTVSFNIGKKVHFMPFKCSKKNKFITHINMMINTWKTIRKVKPDVIIGFWIHPMFYAMLYPGKVGKKLIYSERNDPNLEYGKVSKLLRNRVMKKSVGLIFQTQDAMNYFPPKFYKKSIVIHNPVYIDKDEYEFVEKMDNRIVNVGRLNSQKNQSLLIDAFKDIHQEYPELVLEIYGDGPLRKMLGEKIKQENLSGYVNLKGTCKDVIEKINGARLFVLSSNYEGMPNALMEAMCLGIPVLSTDCPCGGPSELITDNENGFLVQVGDKDALVRKMKYVLNNKNIQEVRYKEKKICETHSQEKIYNQWSEFIRKCIL